jgi:hypothetical protein
MARLPFKGGSATGLSANDAWGEAAVGLYLRRDTKSHSHYSTVKFPAALRKVSRAKARKDLIYGPKVAKRADSYGRCGKGYLRSMQANDRRHSYLPPSAPRPRWPLGGAPLVGIRLRALGCSMKGRYLVQLDYHVAEAMRRIALQRGRIARLQKARQPIIAAQSALDVLEASLRALSAIAS